MCQRQKHSIRNIVIILILGAFFGPCLYAVSNKIAKLADIGLAAEERIAGVKNKQILALQETLADYETWKRNMRGLR